MSDIIRHADPAVLNYIGTALLWWGFGVATVSIFWAIAKRKDEKYATEVIRGMFKDLGHVVDYHRCGPDVQHAHCLCGEASLEYKLEDPTGERLMEQWADNHVNSLMESVGR